MRKLSVYIMHLNYRVVSIDTLNGEIWQHIWDFLQLVDIKVNFYDLWKKRTWNTQNPSKDMWMWMRVSSGFHNLTSLFVSFPLLSFLPNGNWCFLYLSAWNCNDRCRQASGWFQVQKDFKKSSKQLGSRYCARIRLRIWEIAGRREPIDAISRTRSAGQRFSYSQLMCVCVLLSDASYAIQTTHRIAANIDGVEFVVTSRMPHKFSTGRAQHRPLKHSDIVTLENRHQHTHTHRDVRETVISGDFIIVTASVKFTHLTRRPLFAHSYCSRTVRTSLQFDTRKIKALLLHRLCIS